MSDEREALAAEVADIFLDGAAHEASGIDIANAVLTHLFPIASTTEELDALPNGTVVMDCHGEVARKLTYGWRVLVSESGFDAWLSDPLEETYLPATVLHMGDKE